ncbi:MAG TPA: hypothetical protein VMX13_12660 [Sedimentisphaerales bacterium]|nr:hypothetical protein [Sedimentisphaerales bacterium]
MKIDTNGIQDFLEKPAPTQINSVRPRPNDDGDASLRVSYASLIDEAMQSQEVDKGAIDRAQELLLSGELDDPENVREAAGNILRFGI